MRTKLKFVELALCLDCDVVFPVEGHDPCCPLCAGRSWWLVKRWLALPEGARSLPAEPSRLKEVATKVSTRVFFRKIFPGAS